MLHKATLIIAVAISTLLIIAIYIRYLGNWPTPNRQLAELTILITDFIILRLLVHLLKK